MESPGHLGIVENPLLGTCHDCRQISRQGLNPCRPAFFSYSRGNASADVSDGLQGNFFNWISAHKGADGALFFGGQRGLVSFYPDQLKENPYPPEVELTDMRIFNESVVPGADAPLRQAISHEEAITLTHAQNDLTFEYVGLHYSNPEQNQYKYWLEGYDPGWIDASTQRSARYTNLEHGQR